LARSYARLHWQNLVNYGVIPLLRRDDQRIARGDMIRFDSLREELESGEPLTARVAGDEMRFEYDLSPHQIEVILAGGIVNWTERTHQPATV
jgi:aconitate hydratase